MTRSLLVEIVTPDSTVFSGEVASLVATTPDGEVGVFPLHAPMVARLGSGQMRLKRVDIGKTDVYTTEGGYLQVAEDKAIILTDSATTA
jgi:F-type H+-transporting ATPase subunit epsilon